MQRGSVRRIFVAVVALVIASLGVSCGDDTADDALPDIAEDTTTTLAGDALDETTTTSAGEGTKPQLEGQTNDRGVQELQGESVDVEMNDFYFEPTFISADGSQSVSVTLANQGEASHTFTIDSLGIDEVIDAGGSGRTTVELPADMDTLRFYCRFHEGQGMQGAFFPAA